MTGSPRDAAQQRTHHTDMRSQTTAPLPGQARSTAASGCRRRRRTAGLLALALTGLGALSTSATALGRAPLAGRDVVQAGGALTTSVSSAQQTDWVVPLTVSCGGPAATTCRGRLSLIVKVLFRRTGKRTSLVLGSKLYTIKRGAQQTVRITLNPRGRALLTSHAWLKVRVRLAPAAGRGVATCSTPTITLRAPEA